MNKEVEFSFSEITNEGLKREYKVHVPANVVNNVWNDKVEHIRQNLNITGFRPGKVPTSVVEQRYADNVKHELMNEIMNKSLNKLLSDNKFKPIQYPAISNLVCEKGQDFEYQCSFELYPEITLPDFSVIELEKYVCEISDEDLNKRLEEVAKKRKKYQDSDKTQAEDGDRVTINFTGRMDGEEFEGGSSEDFPLILGSKSMIEGFEDQIIGGKLNEKFTINVTFPEKYHSANLAGKAAEFDIVITKIEIPTDQELNDEFAKDLGLENMQELKDKVRELMEKEWKDSSDTKLRKDLFDKLETICEFPLPESMYQQEFDALWQKLEQARKEGNDPEIESKSEEELKQNYSKITKRRVALGLLLAEVNKVNNIRITPQELHQYVVDQTRYLGLPESQIMNYYRNNPKELENFEGPLLERKGVELILNQVKVTENPTDFSKIFELTDIKLDD